LAVQVERPWEFMAKGLDLRLAFGGFTLCLAEGSAYYILLAIFSVHFFGLSTKSHGLSTWTAIV
jgi:hypothetical protein